MLKASYGLFWHNPGPGVSADANPNQNNKSVTYTWTDRNGDRRYQAGEESAAPTATSLAGTIALDASNSQPYSHDVTVYLERQIAPTLGARVGFVYKSEDNLITQYNPGRPIAAYTVPYNFVDIGPDGRAASADDRTLTLLSVPLTADVNTRFPLTNVTMNTPRFSRYKTVEASINKRMSDRWALSTGGSYTWAHDFPGAYPNTPNGVFDEDTSRWDLFNLTNSNAVETRTIATGTSFLRPTGILAPRTARFGARVSF